MSAAQHDEAGASSAPGEVGRISISAPTPGWWKSRWSILGLVIGLVAAGGGAVYAAVQKQIARIDRIEDRSDWIVYTLARIAEKVGVSDVKPPPDPGR